MPEARKQVIISTLYTANKRLTCSCMMDMIRADNAHYSSRANYVAWNKISCPIRVIAAVNGMSLSYILF